MLFSFTEEDTVLDLRNRVAMACKVSVDQFVLVFQSRTLQSSVKVVCTGVQRGHTFYMQGALKGGCKGKDSWVSGIVLNVEPRWFGRLGHLVSGVASREMVLGTLLRCLKAFERVKIILRHSLFLFVVREMGWEGLNGIKARGVVQLVLLRLNLGLLISTIKGGGTNRKSHCLYLILCRRLRRLSSFCKLCPWIQV